MTVKGTIFRGICGKSAPVQDEFKIKDPLLRSSCGFHN